MNLRTVEPLSDCTILVIDDDRLMRLIVEKATEGLGARIVAAESGRQGLEFARRSSPDVVVLDNVLPDSVGIDVLRELRSAAPDVPVLFITGRGSGATAIEAMKLQAFDYLPKPIDVPQLRRQIGRALELRRLVADPAEDVSYLATSTDASETLVGECPRMQAVFKAIGKAAPQEMPVLIRGEHGTGKELVARAIHHNSSRANEPFIKLHCPAFDDERIEEHLLGRVTSDGRPDVVGALESAGSGCLLLQEIGVLSLAVQSRLLQVMREHSCERVGDREPIGVHCRICATSSQELEGLVRSGQFRPDLYYLLSSFTITLPPLRKRPGDLPLLIDQLLRRRSNYSNASRPRISAAALQLLSQYTWPGNIDELQSVLERSLLEATGNVILSDYLLEALQRDSVLEQPTDSDGPHQMTDWAAFADLHLESGTEDLYAKAIAETDRKLLARVLHHTSGNQAQAARILGMTRASLRKKLRAVGLSAAFPWGDSNRREPTL